MGYPDNVYMIVFKSASGPRLEFVAVRPKKEEYPKTARCFMIKEKTPVYLLMDHFNSITDETNFFIEQMW